MKHDLEAKRVKIKMQERRGKKRNPLFGRDHSKVAFWNLWVCGINKADNSNNSNTASTLPGQQLSVSLPVKLCVIHSKADTELVFSFAEVSLSVFQVALNTEIENLGKSYGDNNLDENLSYVEAKNNHINKASWVSKEEFQVYVCAGSSLIPLQTRGLIPCYFLPRCNCLH